MWNGWSENDRLRTVHIANGTDLRHKAVDCPIDGLFGWLDLFIVGRLLGHKQTATTERYSHLAPDPARAIGSSKKRQINIGASRGKGNSAPSLM
jgi:hypothetical protein